MSQGAPKKIDPRDELRRVEFEFFRTISTLVVSAFGLSAALAWNTAITKILEEYLALKPGSGVGSWLVYAVIVTAIAVIVGVGVGQWAERFKKEQITEEKTDLKK